MCGHRHVPYTDIVIKVAKTKCSCLLYMVEYCLLHVLLYFVLFITKFHKGLIGSFLVILLTDKQKNRQRWIITSLAEVKVVNGYWSIGRDRISVPSSIRHYVITRLCVTSSCLGRNSGSRELPVPSAVFTDLVIVSWIVITVTRLMAMNCLDQMRLVIMELSLTTSKILSHVSAIAHSPCTSFLNFKNICH